MFLDVTDASPRTVGKLKTKQMTFGLVGVLQKVGMTILILFA